MGKSQPFKMQHSSCSQRIEWGLFTGNNNIAATCINADIGKGQRGQPDSDWLSCPHGHVTVSLLPWLQACSICKHGQRHTGLSSPGCCHHIWAHHHCLPAILGIPASVTVSKGLTFHRNIYWLEMEATDHMLKVSKSSNSDDLGERSPILSFLNGSHHFKLSSLVFCSSLSLSPSFTYFYL